MLNQYTKNSPFDKNYEPVSIFPLVSKVYNKMRARRHQTISNILFNKTVWISQSTQYTTYLIQTLSFMVKALDKRVSVGSNLMDLSKLYDCLPHG